MTVAEIGSWLGEVVKPLTAYPEQVVVVSKEDEMGVHYSLNLHKDDMGSVIGKGGNTAEALRTLARAVGAKNRMRVSLKVEEPK